VGDPVIFAQGTQNTSFLHRPIKHVIFAQATRVGDPGVVMNRGTPQLTAAEKNRLRAEVGSRVWVCFRWVCVFGVSV